MKYIKNGKLVIKMKCKVFVDKNNIDLESEINRFLKDNYENKPIVDFIISTSPGEDYFGSVIIIYHMSKGV